MNYVIIGNGTAAVGCIEGIRVVDKTSPITVISSEPYPVYGRPLISYLLLDKTTEEKMLQYRPADYYASHGVTTKLGVTVTAIDASTKALTLDNGETVTYDKLCLATGSDPFVPPMTGLDSVTRQTPFMTLDHAKCLQAMLAEQENQKLLIIGAGLIGLKCAEGATHLTRNITVVDMAPRVLPNVMLEAPAGRIQKHMEKMGVEFILSDSVDVFTANTATLKSGRVLDFDILVMAVGVRPCTSLAQMAGCNLNRGILTDDYSLTSVADIYAAGDCTVSHDISDGKDRILALLPNAYIQGETAGMNMAGGHRAFIKAVPMNASGFLGLHMITAGSYEGEVYLEEDANHYKMLVTRDDRLVGYILLGEVDRAGIYTSIIREQTPLSSIDFDLIREQPQLMAFSSTERAKHLGGAH